MVLSYIMTLSISTKNGFISYGSVETRSNATIFPDSPFMIASQAIFPASTASSLSTGLCSCAAARPTSPGFSPLALYPSFLIIRFARCWLTSPKYVARPTWKIGSTIGFPSLSLNPSLATTTIPLFFSRSFFTSSRNLSSSNGRSGR